MALKVRQALKKRVLRRLRYKEETYLCVSLFDSQQCSAEVKMGAYMSKTTSIIFEIGSAPQPQRNNHQDPGAAIYQADMQFCFELGVGVGIPSPGRSAGSRAGSD